MSNDRKLDPLRPHAFCNVCGWRKGGIDSWDGTRCKCGERGSPLPSITDCEIAELAQRLSRPATKRTP